MRLYLSYDINTICKKILQDQLDKLKLNYSIIGFAEVEIKGSFSAEKLNLLNAALKNYSIEIVESPKSIMVQKIKDAIIEMIFREEKLPLKTSSYLADKLCHSYDYLSKLFSNATYTSIENFILQQKTERAKELLAANKLNITEIGQKLNYSSTAHFSNQFKNVTGLTPTAFQRIINKRRTANRN